VVRAAEAVEALGAALAIPAPAVLELPAKAMPVVAELLTLLVAAVEGLG